MWRVCGVACEWLGSIWARNTQVHCGTMTQRSQLAPVVLCDSFWELLRRLLSWPLPASTLYVPTSSRQRPGGSSNFRDAGTQTSHGSRYRSRRQRRVLRIDGREYLAVTITRDELFQETMEFMERNGYRRLAERETLRLSPEIPPHLRFRMLREFMDRVSPIELLNRPRTFRRFLESVSLLQQDGHPALNPHRQGRQQDQGEDLAVSAPLQGHNRRSVPTQTSHDTSGSLRARPRDSGGAGCGVGGSERMFLYPTFYPPPPDSGGDQWVLRLPPAVATFIQRQRVVRGGRVTHRNVRRQLPVVYRVPPNSIAAGVRATNPYSLFRYRSH